MIGRDPITELNKFTQDMYKQIKDVTPKIEMYDGNVRAAISEMEKELYQTKRALWCVVSLLAEVKDAQNNC